MKSKTKYLYGWIPVNVCSSAKYYIQINSAAITSYYRDIVSTK